ncbi:MAG: hypothetical protein M3P91_11495 [Actinomycetota bacterium]|nr:hypothetical protein [Actinomycetota bacterium]
MYAQVLQGNARDPGAVRAALDRWVQDLGPGAIGWLGTTAGVTDDGQLVALIRFDSATSARHNGERAEQAAWMSELRDFCDGELVVADSSRVLVDVVADPDAASFVQVIQGRSKDVHREFDLLEQNSGAWTSFRPDIVASLAMLHEDHTWTMALYFTSEAAAREGEAKEPPAEVAEQMAAMDQLSDGEPEFFDLRQPWLYRTPAVPGV